MKHIIAPLFFIGISFTSFAGSKLDQFARDVVKEYNSMPRVTTRSSEVPAVKLIVQLNEGYTFDDVSSRQVKLDYKLSDECYILEVEIPYIETLAASDAVKVIEHGAPLTPCLKNARMYSNVDAIHAGGEGLPQAYDGTGILTGIYDMGFDPNHPMFKNEDGSSRVKVMYNSFLWRVHTDEQLPAGYVPTSYRLMTISEAVDKYGTDSKFETHGHQCVGIMAGGVVTKAMTDACKFGDVDNATVTEGDIPFYGVAKNSDVYLSCGLNNQADILSNFAKIVDYAEWKNQPLVLSLSQAAYAGPHDGSTIFNREIERLGKKAIICIASGNAGDTKMAVSKTLTSDDSSLKTTLKYYYGYPGSVQFWASDNRLLTPEFGMMDLATNKMVFSIKLNFAATSTINEGTTPDFDKVFKTGTSGSIVVESGVDSRNDRAYVNLTFSKLQLVDENTANTIVPVIILNGSEGQTIDGIINNEGYEFVSAGLDGYMDGNADGAFNDLAAGNNVISVGAYNSCIKWRTLNNGNNQIWNTLGGILGYSSYGKTADGRQIPTVCAPGMKISCPLNSYYLEGEYSSDGNDVVAYAKYNDREYFWQTSQGTSLAAPFVAGTVALWLQAYPEMTFQEAQEILATTAVKDQHVTSSQWGNGKLDALAGIKKALELRKAGVENIDSDAALQLIVTKAGAKRYNVFYGGDVAGFRSALYSMSGSMVKSTNVEGSEYELDCTALQSGVYMLEVSGDNFREVRKIIVD